MASLGTIGKETATALKAEARRRAEAGCFFSSIVYMSLVAERPASTPGAATLA